MFSFVFSLGLVLLPAIAAQTVHDIQVGGDKLAFSPEAIFANPGDQVVFHFNPKNHTVTQSSFPDPCGPKAGGIDSGFMPVAANATSPTYTVQVNDTNPIWIYCKQAAGTPNSHCGAGMVFAINCGADGEKNSFTNFKNSALAVGASLSAAAASATGDAYGYGSATTSAAASDITADPVGNIVTATIALQSSTWTTTYSSYPGSPNATPASLTGNVHKVIVGGSAGLVFDPPRVDAQPRDTIVFEFHSKNHTVTQSTFGSPCVQMALNGVEGFDSGFMPVATDATEFPTYNITVKDTAPIWAFCRQANHCGSGMVFAVNSVESSAKNYSAFQSLAKSSNGTSSASSGSGYSGAISSVTSRTAFLAGAIGVVFVALL